jgi:hypothetical protein
MIALHINVTTPISRWLRNDWDSSLVNQELLLQNEYLAAEERIFAGLLARPIAAVQS